jgi:hypothetical protein
MIPVNMSSPLDVLWIFVKGRRKILKNHIFLATTRATTLPGAAFEVRASLA